MWIMFRTTGARNRAELLAAVDANDAQIGTGGQVKSGWHKFFLV